MHDDPGNLAPEPKAQPDKAGQRREPLPAARPGESLRPYVTRIAPHLMAWLDATRRWRRRAEWEIIRTAVEVAYGEPVALGTLETYLAAARKAAAAPPAQVPEEPPPAPPPLPTAPIRAPKVVRNGSQSPGANRADRFIAPRP